MEIIVRIAILAVVFAGIVSVLNNLKENKNGNK